MVTDVWYGGTAQRVLGECFVWSLQLTGVAVYMVVQLTGECSTRALQGQAVSGVVVGNY